RGPARHAHIGGVCLAHAPVALLRVDHVLVPDEIGELLEGKERRLVADPGQLQPRVQAAVEVAFDKRADIDARRQELGADHQAVDVLDAPVRDPRVAGFEARQTRRGHLREQLLVGDVVSAVGDRVAEKQDLAFPARVPVALRAQAEVVDLEVRAAEAPGLLVGLQPIAVGRMRLEQHRPAQAGELPQRDLGGEEKEQQECQPEEGEHRPGVPLEHGVLVRFHRPHRSPMSRSMRPAGDRGACRRMVRTDASGPGRGYSRHTLSPSRRNAAASHTDFTSIRQPRRTIFSKYADGARSTNCRCATAITSASAAGRSSHAASRSPYSTSASSAFASGSWTKVCTPNSCSSRTMSITFELRMSGTFSLNVSPRMLTRAPLMLRPAWIIRCTVLRAMWLPMPSLMRRPARITSGW